MIGKQAWKWIESTIYSWFTTVFYHHSWIFIAGIPVYYQFWCCFHPFPGIPTAICCFHPSPTIVQLRDLDYQKGSTIVWMVGESQGVVMGMNQKSMVIMGNIHGDTSSNQGNLTGDAGDIGTNRIKGYIDPAEMQIRQQYFNILRLIRI